MAEILDIARSLAANARDGEEVEVVIGRGVETEIRVYRGEIESLTQASSADAGIRIIVDHRVGFATAGSVDPEELARTLAKARENAGYALGDPANGLARPDGHPSCRLELASPSFGDASLEEKILLAKETERGLFARDRRVADVQHTAYADARTELAIASSTGIEVHQDRTTAYLVSEAVAGDGGAPQTGFGYSVGRALEDLDPEEVVGEAADLAIGLLGAKKPASGRVQALFAPRMAATLLSILGGALSASSVSRGRSIFAGRVGEQVAAACFDLADDPTDANFFRASAFDGEGLATRRNQLIAGGVLTELLFDSYNAREQGRSSNASALRGALSLPSPGPRALALRPGTRSPEEIVAGIDDGVLVQSMSGVHSGVNAVSGDFSVGIEGIRIANGALAEPIREATLSSSLQRILAGVIAIGSDLRYLPSAAAGVSLLIDEMSLGGS